MKKKTLLMITSAVLVMALVIGGTLMFLSGTTGQATNTINFSSFELELDDWYNPAGDPSENVDDDNEGFTTDKTPTKDIGIDWSDWDPADIVEKYSYVVNNSSIDVFVKVMTEIDVTFTGTVPVLADFEDEPVPADALAAALEAIELDKARIVNYILQNILGNDDWFVDQSTTFVALDPVDGVSFADLLFYGATAGTLDPVAADAQLDLLVGDLDFSTLTGINFEDFAISIKFRATGAQVADNDPDVTNTRWS